MPEDLKKYLDAFVSLSCNKVGQHERPHKPVLLLAVLDLFETGRLKENREGFSPELREIFRRYFEIVRAQDDSATPIDPFFYLKSDKFWHHAPKPGKEVAYQHMRGPKGIHGM
ncbi:MAG: hypothetical protein JXR37_29705 [Kiritimatiellae bacterium]|nr:hypothetical protein [Kiritimatiellia bacterium]